MIASFKLSCVQLTLYLIHALARAPGHANATLRLHHTVHRMWWQQQKTRRREVAVVLAVLLCAPFRLATGAATTVE